MFAYCVGVLAIARKCVLACIIACVCVVRVIVALCVFCLLVLCARGVLLVVCVSALCGCVRAPPLIGFSLIVCVVCSDCAYHLCRYVDIYMCVCCWRVSGRSGLLCSCINICIRLFMS